MRYHILFVKGVEAAFLENQNAGKSFRAVAKGPLCIPHLQFDLQNSDYIFVQYMIQNQPF